MKLSFSQLIPPLVSTIYRNYKNGVRGFYIWKGVFQNFTDVPKTSKGYFDDQLTQGTEAATRSLLDGLNNQKRIPYHVNEENSLLPLLSAAVLRNKRKVSVLDLGGGMGVGFISLLSCLESVEGSERLEYFVVETPAMCAGGSQLFKEDKRIHFLSEFPDKMNHIDIVFINSALQYFEKYAEILKQLTSYSPEYVLFVKLSAGNITTYATAQQSLNGSSSPCWFFSIEEFISLMNTLGYSLDYKSAISRVYDQDNFASQYQLDKACNLLFSRNSSAA